MVMVSVDDGIGYKIKPQIRKMRKWTDSVDELEDQVKFSSSSKCFPHLDDVFMFETAQQPQLT